MGKYFLIPQGWGELTRPSLPYSAVWRWPLLPHSKGGMYLENTKLDSAVKFDAEIWAYSTYALDKSTRLLPRNNINTILSWANIFASVVYDTVVNIQAQSQAHRLLHALTWQCLTSVCCYVLISYAERVCLNSSTTSVGVSCRSQVFGLRNIPFCLVLCIIMNHHLIFTLRPKEQLDRKPLLGAVFSAAYPIIYRKDTSMQYYNRGS